jgi:hypothetical protein
VQRSSCFIVLQNQDPHRLYRQPVGEQLASMTYMWASFTTASELLSLTMSE